jgi:hypothetical protein
MEKSMNNLNVTETYKTISDFYVGMALPEKITVLYARLSQDDKNKNKGDDSDSIVNQKAILCQISRTFEIFQDICLIFVSHIFLLNKTQKPPLVTKWRLIYIFNFIFKNTIFN